MARSSWMGHGTSSKWGDRAAALQRRSASRLGRTWDRLYDVLVWLSAAFIRVGGRETTVYLRGSFATDEQVLGLSDIDLEVVTDSLAAAERIRARVERVQRLIPTFGKLFSVEIYERETFRRSLASLACPTEPTFFGLPHAFHGSPIETRPGLRGPARAWKRLAGEELRGAPAELDLQQRRVASWLELQHWWRYAYEACIRPVSAYTPYLCAKLVADPARIWILLEHGELIGTRREALRVAAPLLAEERSVLEHAAEILDALGSTSATPPASVETVLPFLVRISALIGARIGRDVSPAGATPVTLWASPHEQLATDADRTADVNPLCDWRARCFRPQPDETFRTVAGNPAEKADLVRAGDASQRGPQMILSERGLLFLPMTGVLRTIQCEATDPVTFALSEGRLTARFPNVRSWSAEDSAAREIAEHRNWLAADRRRYTEAHSVALLLGAARAAFFLDTLRQGQPVLALTCSAAADALAALDGKSRSIGAAAAESYIDYRRGGSPPPPRIVADLRAAVGRLPSYVRDDRPSSLTS